MIKCDFLEQNFTKVVNNQIHFNLEETEENKTNLIEYTNKECEKCSCQWSIDNPPDCDCPVSRLYYAMCKLAEWEAFGLSIKQMYEIKRILKKIEN